MAIIVSLKDIVEALEMGSQTAENILDPATGEVLLVTDDDQLAIEDPDTDLFQNGKLSTLIRFASY